LMETMYVMNKSTQDAGHKTLAVSQKEE
jgi:hypothetical protein